MTFSTEIKSNDVFPLSATGQGNKAYTSSFYYRFPVQVGVVVAATIINLNSAVTLHPQPINHSSATTLEKQSSRIARTIIDAQYQAAHIQVIEQMQIEHLEPLNTEDDFLAAAVEITKRK
ncbi:hypothetical protein [Chamaesiphon sp.]|uniref:hypothetical protein n=1 Tax=Chamaesiphon sp. TaxID=2814140 RepID=UPI0035946227